MNPQESIKASLHFHLDTAISTYLILSTSRLASGSNHILFL